MVADVRPLPPVHDGFTGRTTSTEKVPGLAGDARPDTWGERWAGAVLLVSPVDMPTEAPVAGTAAAADADADAWFRACVQVTERAERLPEGGGALLELGVCTADEAREVMRGLLERLAWQGVVARAGIGPGLALAQLAAQSARRPGRIVLLSTSETRDFLRRVPVEALLALHPHGVVTPECVARLRRYGLTTLGHVARVAAADDRALRRQFGPAGAFLDAVVRGGDPRPLVPTPPAPRLRFRLRLPEPLAGPRIIPLLPRWAEQISQQLHRRGTGGRTLLLVVRTEGLGNHHIHRTLRAPVDDAHRLARELSRMLAALLEHTPLEDGVPKTSPGGALSPGTPVSGLRLTVGDLAPVYPEQRLFWTGGSQRRATREATLEPVAEALALRTGGRPQLLRPHIALPDAVFEEERYYLAPFTPITPATQHSVTNGEQPGQHGKTKRPMPVMPDVADAADGWDRVPHRLHWW